MKYASMLKSRATHLLLVDDNQNGLLARKSLLEELGFVITTATNGEEAFEAFSKGKFDLPRISYFFDQEMTNIAGEASYAATFDAVDNWREKWDQSQKPYLKYRKSWSTIFIFDGRQEQPRTHRYHDQEAALYEYCSDARTPRDISTNFSSEPWVEGALKEFLAKDLMLFLDGRYLSLALPENRNFELEAGPSAKIMTGAQEQRAETFA